MGEPSAFQDSTSDSNCLFCKIVIGTIPASMVLEHPLAIAFRDINPTAPTHVLVIPRRHIAHAGTIGAEDVESVAALFTAAREVAAIDGLTEQGYRLVFNVGEDAGNSVAHLHLHVIGGRRMGWPPFAP